jgi:hypothetical protein
MPLAAAMVLFGCGAGSGEAETRRLEFSDLRSADRMDVRAPFDRSIAVLTDRDKIQAATEFIEQQRDGWVDVWTGPRAPELMFEFYSGSKYLGGFGISRSYLVAGSLSKDVPPEGITVLARRLGLEWPRRD